MPMTILRACCAVELPEGLPEWIQLLPAGEIETRDGRGPWKNTAPEMVLSEFASWGMPIAIDYDHQSESAEDKSGPVPAAGWIHELAIRDGAIYGRVTWTQQAAGLIAAAEYRYISPVFNFDKKTGIVVRIVGAGLTNRPNLFLEAIAASRGGGPMNKLLEELCYMLNLPITTTAEEMQGHLDRLKGMLAQGEAAITAMKPLGEALGLPETTTVAEIAAAAQARFSESPDLGTFVPRAEFDRVAASLTQLQSERRSERTGRAVSTAIEAGKLSPAMKEWATAYCNRDPEGFASYVEKMPAIFPGNNGAPPVPPQAKDTELDEGDRAVCAQMGIDPEKYKASRERK